MKTSKIKAAAILGLAFFLTAGLDAQVRDGRGMGPCGQGDGPGGPGAFHQAGQGYGRHQARPFAGLDLSEEQADQLKALRLEHYKDMKPLRSEMAELKVKKHNLQTAIEVDLDAVNKVIDKQTALSAKMQKLNAKHRAEARKLLTEEQLMQLDQRRAYASQKGGNGPHFNRTMQCPRMD